MANLETTALAPINLLDIENNNTKNDITPNLPHWAPSRC